MLHQTALSSNRLCCPANLDKGPSKPDFFFQSELCVFFLAVQPAENARPQAVVFKLNEHTPALVCTFELVMSEQEGGIDSEQFNSMNEDRNRYVDLNFVSSDEKEGSKCDEINRSEFPKKVESHANAGNISNDTHGSAKCSSRGKQTAVFPRPTKPDANFKGKRHDHSLSDSHSIQKETERP